MGVLKDLSWNASRLISQNGGPFSKALYQAARLYTKTYNNLNYDMNTNGEFYLLDKLGALNVKTVLDVGANKGEYANACLSRFKDAKIHCFEIVPATFAKLEANVMSPRVSLNKFGLSDSQGVLEINYNPDDDGSSSLIEGSNIHDGAWQKVVVKVIPGDQYCVEKSISSIDLLKVDVEGAEHLVFNGFSDAFSQGIVGAVQFEFGMVNIYSKFLLKDFWEFFESRGFSIGPVMPRGVDFKKDSTRDEDFQGPPNYFAVHKSRSDIMAAVSRV